MTQNSFFDLEYKRNFLTPNLTIYSPTVYAMKSIVVRFMGVFSLLLIFFFLFIQDLVFVFDDYFLDYFWMHLDFYDHTSGDSLIGYKVNTLIAIYYFYQHKTNYSYKNIYRLYLDICDSSFMVSFFNSNLGCFIKKLSLKSFILLIFSFFFNLNLELLLIDLNFQLFIVFFLVQLFLVVFSIDHIISSFKHINEVKPFKSVEFKKDKSYKFYLSSIVQVSLIKLNYTLKYLIKYFKV